MKNSIKIDSVHQVVFYLTPHIDINILILWQQEKKLQFQGNKMEVKQRILVVDDNLPQRIIHESYLKELGYEVELAEDGFAAMASLKLGIDLIILDLKMPGMDGYEVTKKIRQDPEYFNIPIIVVSSLSSDVE